MEDAAYQCIKGCLCLRQKATHSPAWGIQQAVWGSAQEACGGSACGASHTYLILTITNSTRMMPKIDLKLKDLNLLLFFCWHLEIWEANKMILALN